MKIYKHLKLIILFLSLNGICLSQNSLQSDIDRIYNTIKNYPKSRDSLDILNNRLVKLIIHSANDSNIFKINVDRNKNVTSKDGMFKLISWNAYDGGTMPHIITIAIWRDKNNLIHGMKLAFNELHIANSNIDSLDDEVGGIKYDSIYQVTIKDINYYLSVGSNSFSNEGYVAEMNVFYIKENYLELGAIIREENKLTAEISTEFEYQYLRNHPFKTTTKNYPTITFDRKTNKIIVPGINEKGVITNKIYTLKGNIFKK